MVQPLLKNNKHMGMKLLVHRVDMYSSEVAKEFPQWLQHLIPSAAMDEKPSFPVPFWLVASLVVTPT